MKKNLGKLLLLTLLFTSNLFASNLATYSLKVDKHTAYIKEPITITFRAEQKNKKDVMFFFFSVKKNPAYDIELLTSKTKELGKHHALNQYTFILFPLKEGSIDVAFDFSIRTASEKSVAHSYVEDHDDSKAIQMDVTNIALEPIHLKIKALEKKVDLVGDFTLNTEIDKKSIDQFGSVNLHYTLKGVGYKAQLTPLQSIKDVTLFSDTQEDTHQLTPDGYKIHKQYLYSLSAKRSFHIQKKEITLFSPSKNRYYKINLPSFDISVKPINTKELLDRQEFPTQTALLSFTKMKEWLIYLAIFIMGFITAKLINYAQSRKTKEKNYQDIRQSKNELELILILLNNYADREIKECVSELEALKYHKGTKSFNQIKKELLATL